MKIQRFLISAAMTVSSVLPSPAQDSEAIVYPEDWQYDEATLSDGSKAVVTPQWIQDVGFQDDGRKYPCFAVSGDYFYILHDTNYYPNSIIIDCELLRFNAVSGRFDRAVEINWGAFEPHDYGYLGTDDAGNLFISSGYREQDNLTSAGHVFAPCTISLLDEDGNVTGQIRTSAPYLPHVEVIGNTYWVYNYILVKGNLKTGEGLFVMLPLMAYDAVHAAIRLAYFPFYEDGVVSYPEPATSLALDVEIPETERSYYDYYSLLAPTFSVLDYIPGKLSAKYDYKNGECCYGVFSGHGIAGTVYNMYDESMLKNVAPIEVSGTGPFDNQMSGANIARFGDTHLLFTPVMTNSGGFKLLVNEAMIEVSEDYCIARMPSNASLWKMPNSESFGFELTTSETKPYPRATVCVVDNTEGGNPRADVFFYAPGRGMAYYTISDKAVATGVESPVSGDGDSLSWSSGRLSSSAASDVKVHDVAGRVVRMFHIECGGSEDLSGLPSGVYIATDGKSVVKIAKQAATD